MNTCAQSMEISNMYAGHHSHHPQLLLYLDIIIMRWKALRLLWGDVDVRAHQSPEEALQLLLNPPQLILTTHRNLLRAASTSTVLVPQVRHLAHVHSGR